MTYQKYLIVASKKDKAGINITTRLSQFRGNPLLSSMKQAPNYDFYLVDEEIVYTENLNMEKINKYDFIIFASRHSSEKGGKTLSVHSPGNFRRADFGGESGKVCRSSALFQKQMFEKLNENAKAYHLEEYAVTLEATHHGPLIDKPCLFIEIGSTDIEWTDRRAAFVVAKTIDDVVRNYQENKFREVAIGIGGPHYCPGFNKIQLNSNVAISHIISQYVLPLSEEMMKEAVEKTEEEIDFVLLDWKGIGNAQERERIIEILENLNLSYRKTGEIKK
ncbi:MAG TPA: D-aminoacyl-tRNA deacylase [Candidatus Omnitrophota bacterium]|nr:D-aminoacyl-tRNA deacylase [Candidatus Omnitrophota bacterium]